MPSSCYGTMSKNVSSTFEENEQHIFFLKKTETNCQHIYTFKMKRKSNGLDFLFRNSNVKILKYKYSCMS